MYLEQGKIKVGPSLVDRRGVFANQTFFAKDIIEECYSLPTSENSDDLVDYLFKVEEKCYLALGCGSIYNHAESPNADIVFDIDSHKFTVIACKKINKNEEIFLSYGNKWFQSRGLKPKKISASSFS